MSETRENEMRKKSIECSIIMPVYNEADYIEQSIMSVINNEWGDTSYELILVDGGSEDGTVEKIKKLQKKYNNLVLLKNPKRIAPTAMNIGIEASKGRYIFVVSAHAFYEKGYFVKLLNALKTLQADLVGPVLRTDTLKNDATATAIVNVLSDKLGVGSAFRSGVAQVEEVDTVPFGCYRKEVFDTIGLYDERLVRNQDIELNKRLKRAGGKIYLVPDISCTYYARETFGALARNNFENGRWNILTAWHTGRLGSLSLRHYIPLLFVLGLLLPLFCCAGLSVAMALVYIVVIAVRSYQIKKKTTWLHQMVAFVVLHISYGLGEMAGLAEVVKKIWRKETK